MYLCHSANAEDTILAGGVNPTEGITCSEARSLMAAKSSPGDSLWQPQLIPDRLWRLQRILPGTVIAGMDDNLSV